MSTLTERVELMEKHGMVQAVAGLKFKAEQEAALKEALSLKFKPVTQAEVISRLRFYGWAWERCWRRSHESQAWVVLAPIAAVSFVLGSWLYGATKAAGDWAILFGLFTVIFGVSAILSVLTMLFFFLHGVWRTKVENVSLINWRHDMPYGALLAVQEAKEKGIKDFQVWFPIKDENYSMVPVLDHDPIITGMLKGIRVEVYAWNEKTVF